MLSLILCLLCATAGYDPVPGSSQTAVITLEKGGVIEIALYDDTPVTSGNFIRLATEEFYDGLKFHRVVPGFVAQGGDPLGTGFGEPGYFLPEEKSPGHHAVRGMVSMARTGTSQPNVYGHTSGSQFFIMLGAAPRLDPNFCFFGIVTVGMDVVDKIAVGDKIKSITVKPTDTGGEQPR
jgi:peptidyl-prolyl cis-trans isomerase B (cyclophilin B)